ncbi:MAG TPA: MFS transporter [Candidatus Dormibacteraeota bacterium]|nr:MFS transporter [Candidatus Dormibacteraeota bacterium]
MADSSPTVAAAAAPIAESLPASPRSLRALVVDRAFPALRHRNYRLFFLGQLISLTGTWTQVVAQGWLVWTLSHSAFLLGVIAGLQSAPVLLFGLWGGVIADRVAKRELLIATQAAAALLALAMAVLVSTGAIAAGHPQSLALVGLLAFALGTVNAFDAPARQAWVVELVGKKHLLNAISLNSSVFNGTRILGPVVATTLINTAGTAVCFYVNAASFVPVIAGLWLIRPTALAARRASGSTLESVREAAAYIRQQPVVLDLFATVVVASVLVYGYLSLLPAFADGVLHAGSAGYGAMTLCNGAGALVAALSLAVRGNGRRRQGFRIVAGAVGLSLLVAAFALSPSLPLSLALMTLVGWAGVGFLARANTVLQTTVPDELRGRVMSLYVLILMGLLPIASVQLGGLARLLGAPGAVASEALLAAALLVALHLRRPHVRGMAE